MNFETIKTPRLTLIPADTEILEYELKKEKKAVPKKLSGITIPENWPHESVKKDVMEVFLNLYNQKRLFNYYWILDSSNNDNCGKVLIGSGGFIVHDNMDFELGYSVLKQYENNGYATEAIEATIKKALSSGIKGRIIAKTEENNFPSKRILEKNGFSVMGLEEETGHIVYLFQNKE